MRFYIVRREKVRKALEWLVQNNPHYHDIIIDRDRIAQLPTEGIPDEVFQQFTSSSATTADAAGHSRYDAPDAGNYIHR